MAAVHATSSILFDGSGSLPGGSANSWLLPACLPRLQSILESAWSPSFNATLLDAMGGRRTLLSEL